MRRFILSLLYAASVCILLSVPAFAGDKYVASSLGDTLTLPEQTVVSATHTDIQAAIDDPTTTDGDTVWVQDGFICDTGAHFYKPYDDPTSNPRVANRIIVNKKITLRSVSGTIENPFMVIGAPDPDSANGFGNNAIRCVRLCGDATLIGCVATNGYTTTQADGDLSGNGGGVIFDGPNNTVYNSLFICNNANYGGAIAASTRNPIGDGSNNRVYDSILTKNYSLNQGSAAYQYYGSVTLYNCQIIENKTSSVTRFVPLVDCVIANNHITLSGNERGPTISSSELTRCIVTNNSAINEPIISGQNRYGCVIANNYSQNVSTIQGGDFHNCTILNNRSDSTYSAINGSSSCHNTISWGNTSNPSSVYWSYSCAPEAGSFSSCISSDPMLTFDPVSMLPVLADPNSPCIDAASTPNAKVGMTDILGNPRISGLNCDMGAVELNLNGDDILIISASPRMGVSSPAYGNHINASGASFTCSMTDGDQIEDPANPSVRYRCRGYSIFTNPNNPTLDSERSGTTSSFTYTHEGWANLQWKFEPSYVFISVSDGENSLPASGWASYNSTVTITAPEIEGKVFVKWTGDIKNIIGTDTDATISFTATSPRTIFATYSFDSAPEDYSYVSKSGLPHYLYGMGFSDLQTAINSTPVGGTVWIEDGFVCDTGTSTYNNSNFRIAITKNITVRSVSGSYEGGTTILGVLNSVAAPLGDSAVRGVYLNNGGKLIGVTIRNAATKRLDNVCGYGGGVQIQHADSFIRNCRITHCYAYCGGAVGTMARGVTVYDSVFDDCFTPVTSYGSLCYGPNNVGYISFSGCTISNITDDFSFRADPQFYNCTFTKNDTAISDSAIKTYNSLFVGNLSNFSVSGASHYGSIFLNNAYGAKSGNFYNCTFYGNTVRGVSGGTLYNCIAWNNGGTDSGTFKNSCYPGANGTNGNTNQDPNLVLNEKGFPIPACPSPCIDSANPDYISLLLPLDILGKKRVRGDALDMGALEAGPKKTLLFVR